jgi:hypothetical protein
MASMEFAQFQSACSEQGVSLHERISGLRLPREKINYDAYAPTSMMRAIVRAGRILSTGYEPLADGKLELDERIQTDTAALALFDIVNSSVDPEDDSLDAIPNFRLASYPGIWACRLAELRFIKAYEELEQGIGKCQIVSDGSKRALFLRKSDVQPSAVSLARVRIEGVVYMPGSLFLLELLSDPPRRKIDVSQYEGIQTYSIDQVRGATFTRLTTLPLRTSERNFSHTDFALASYFKYLHANRQTVQTVTIDDMADVANNALVKAENTKLVLAP